MSSGAFPPDAAQLSKYHVSHRRGLSFQWASVATIENIAAASRPLHRAPETEQALRRAIGQAHRRYTRRINFREKWRGYLWQGRFGSFVMDEPYLAAAAR
jgi:putative transposase